MANCGTMMQASVKTAKLNQNPDNYCYIYMQLNNNTFSDINVHLYFFFSFETLNINNA